MLNVEEERNVRRLVAAWKARSHREERDAFANRFVKSMPTSKVARAVVRALVFEVVLSTKFAFVTCNNDPSNAASQVAYDTMEALENRNAWNRYLDKLRTKGIGKFTSFVVAVATRTACDRARRKWRKPLVHAMDHDTLEALGAVCKPVFSQNHHLSSDNAFLLIQALNLLLCASPNEAQGFYLRHVCGYTWREVADLANFASSDAARIAVRRLRIRIREQLKKGTDPAF